MMPTDRPATGAIPWRHWAGKHERGSNFTSGNQANGGATKVRLVHANFHNHVSQEDHLVDRQTYKTRRSAALLSGR